VVVGSVWGVVVWGGGWGGSVVVGQGNVCVCEVWCVWCVCVG